MTIETKRLAGVLAGATLAGVLLAGISTPAFASSPNDAARLEAVQQQLDSLRAQLDALKASGETDARLSALQAQLDAMGRQLAELQAAQQADASAITTLQTPKDGATTLSLPNGKPAFATADGRFTANIRATLMMDVGKYFQDDDLPAAVVGRDLNDGSNFRRARIGLDGRVFRDFDYALVYEFGGSGGEDPGRLYEFSLTYTAFKPWRVKLGAYEPNVGLAAAVSTSQMPLMERPSPAEVARSIAAGDSRVALQFTGNGVWGEGDTGLATRWFLSTAVTGNTISTISSAGGASAQPADEQQAWVGRVAIAPFVSTDWQAHLGLNAQYVFRPNDAGATASPRYPIQLRDRPELRLDGTRLVDTGAIDARHALVYGAEAALLVRNAALESEYFHFDIERRPTGAALPDPRFNGWYVQGSWLLTGEQRSYNAAEARIDGPKLTSNFDPATGSWGAFELAARYSVLDLNFREGAGGAIPAGAIRGGEQKISTLGLNWYLNPALRFMLDWQHVDVDRLSTAGDQAGQSYNAVAARAQFTF